MDEPWKKEILEELEKIQRGWESLLENLTPEEARRVDRFLALEDFEQLKGVDRILAEHLLESKAVLEGVKSGDISSSFAEAEYGRIERDLSFYEKLINERSDEPDESRLKQAIDPPKNLSHRRPATA